MTAEIGILNRYGVALAADSAVTVGINKTLKVLNTANKLFNLSNHITNNMAILQVLER